MKKRNLVIGWTVAVCVGIAGWIAFHDKRPKFIGSGKPNEAYVFLTPWANPDGYDPASSSFHWLLRQCRVGLKYVAPNHQEEWLSAVKFEKMNPHQWSVTLKSDQKWSDGPAVTSEDFVFAWTLRKPMAATMGLSQIASLEAVSPLVLRVTFNKDTSPEVEAAGLSSVWLSPLKASADIKEWSPDLELAAPCNGPFLVEINSPQSVTLMRSPATSEEASVIQTAPAVQKTDLTPHGLLDSILVTAHLTSPFDDTAALLAALKAKKISFERGRTIEDKFRSDFISYSRSTVGGPAYYFWINPQGSIKGNRVRFIHESINRGELVVIDKTSNLMKPMNRLVPLSIQSEKSRQSLSAQLGNLNFESVQAASATLKIPVAKPPVGKATFTIHLKIPQGEFFGQLARRYAGRMKANYGVEVLPSAVEAPITARLPQTVDMAIIQSTDTGSIRDWAASMAKQLKLQAGSDTSDKVAINLLDQISNLGATVAEQNLLKLLVELDTIILGSGHLLPLGQIGKEYYIDPSLQGVGVYEDASMDPDLSRAQRISAAE